jgi:SAM-dependent methyltransferase
MLRTMNDVWTANNPGAFTSRPVRGPRTMAAAAGRALSRGNYRIALVGLVVDATNLVEARALRRLPPRYRCTCCGHLAHAFRHMMARADVSWHSACPRCDSRSRHRGLAILLPELIEKIQPKRILHFAPEPVLQQFLTQPGVQYETADLYLQDVTHRDVDICALPFADRTYDLIVCNHVLEHLPDDAAALRELARVVTPNGAVLITVPGDFRRGNTVHFTGELENGHYRDYGTDFIDRLRRIFADVEVRDLHDYDRDPNGLSRAIRPRDLAFVCRSAPRR